MRAFLLGLVLCFPSAALAQDSEVVIAAHAHVLPVIHVTGSPPTPVTLFIPRAHVRFTPRDVDHHAVDRIVESVSHAPF